jgi:DNA primase
MGLISEQTREQIRAANDIVDVIGAYLPLQRAGAAFRALCPFHKEKTPSFYVNPQRQIFHCFGCHKGGDVFTFVQEYENISFPEALRRLAERARIPLDFEEDAGGRQARSLKDTLRQIHEQITQRWHQALLHDAAGRIARDYLAQRGVSDEAVKLFRLGYAPEAWDDTVNWAKSKGYDLATVEQAGLIIRKEDASARGARYYDRFRGRLMFPIADEQGRVIGFSGRVLRGDEQTAKYVNSPETPLFIKSKVIFGLDKAKRAILDAGFAIVCEGQLDLITCYMAGLQNIVAPQGTALTADHARLLKRYTDEVVLCFDSDAAGQAAAIRALDDLLASGLAIRVATVPAPHDPDSFVRTAGADALRELIARAPGFFDYYLQRLSTLHDLNTDKGRQALLRAMATAVHQTGNAVLIDTWAQKTAQRLGVAVEAVRAEFNKLHRRGTAVAAAVLAPEEPATTDEARPASHEFWLLKLLLLDDDLVDWAARHLDPDWIQHATVREVVRRRLRQHAEHTWHSVAALLADPDTAAARSLITEALSEQREIPHRAQQLHDVTLRLRNQALDRRIARLAQRLADPTTPEEVRLRCLQEQATLRQLKRQPLAPLAAAA